MSREITVGDVVIINDMDRPYGVKNKISWKQAPWSGKRFAISFCGPEEGLDYQEDLFVSLEDAVSHGVSVGAKEFWVGECVAPTQPEEFWKASDWLRSVSCQDAYWDDSTSEERAELERDVRRVLAAWLDKHDLRPKLLLVPNPVKYTHESAMAVGDKIVINGDLTKP